MVRVCSHAIQVLVRAVCPMGETLYTHSASLHPGMQMATV